MSVVNASYRWNAGDYARHSESQQQWGKELIAKLRLAGDEHLLDIGCGDGKVTAEIAARLPRGKVVGIDSSAEMITLAGTRYAENQFTNLRFVKMDARKLSFCAEFDVVFSNAALHWVIDHNPVLSGIYEALKPGGRLLMQMGGRGNAAVLVSVLEQVISEEKWRPYFNGFSFPYGFYGPDEYRPWLRAAGFDAKPNVSDPYRPGHVPRDRGKIQGLDSHHLAAIPPAGAGRPARGFHRNDNGKIHKNVPAG